VSAFLTKKTDLTTMSAYQEKLDAVNRVINDFVDRKPI
jgi:hypothetical protein